MSYDIDLKNPVTGKAIELDVPHHMRGGTYQLGGSTSASLNITWNYSDHYYRAFGNNGIHAISGKTGAESIPILKAAASRLGDDVDEADYWKATEGNAKAALMQLLSLATMRPDGVWYVS